VPEKVRERRCCWYLVEPRVVAHHQVSAISERRKRFPLRDVRILAHGRDRRREYDASRVKISVYVVVCVTFRAYGFKHLDLSFELESVLNSRSVRYLVNVPPLNRPGVDRRRGHLGLLRFNVDDWRITGPAAAQLTAYGLRVAFLLEEVLPTAIG
jgi:hypothetical protein